jgi:hypothetical protein
MKTINLQTVQGDGDVRRLSRRYISVGEAHERYGPTPAAFRRWIMAGVLGDAVIHCGRLVRLDAAKLDERLQQTGQLLCRSKGR